MAVKGSAPLITPTALSTILGYCRFELPTVIQPTNGKIYRGIKATKASAFGELDPLSCLRFRTIPRDRKLWDFPNATKISFVILCRCAHRAALLDALSTDLSPQKLS